MPLPAQMEVRVFGFWGHTLKCDAARRLAMEKAVAVAVPDNLEGYLMAAIEEVKQVLGETLQLGNRANDFTAETSLFGAIAEFDSMAVVTVVTALEERFGIFVEDDEIDADVFATVGSLAAFVDQKLEA